MNRRYHEEDVIEAIELLTPGRLERFVRMQVVAPMPTDAGPVFRDIDLARLELLCDLSEHFDMEDDALEIVMSLIDQMHALRRRLRIMARAIAAEPEEVRLRIARFLCENDDGEADTGHTRPD